MECPSLERHQKSTETATGVPCDSNCSMLVTQRCPDVHTHTHTVGRDKVQFTYRNRSELEDCNDFMALPNLDEVLPYICIYLYIHNVCVWCVCIIYIYTHTYTLREALYRGVGTSEDAKRFKIAKVS